MKQRPTLDEYFLKFAMLAAERSTCMRRNVGSIIVKDKHILTTGYNGAPAGTKDCTELGCQRDELKIPSGTQQQICRAVHAEQNAIIQAAFHGVNVKGATLYCTHTPCVICAKMIVNAGITRVVSYSTYNDDAFLKLFEEADIKFEHLTKPTSQIAEHDRVTLYSTDSQNYAIAAGKTENLTVESAENVKSDFLGKVFIYDEFSPQDSAMMQALYSRSPKSVVEHVEKVKQSGSGKFMEQFYVGYGHASIADCGSTTLFIENVSILADKAIQDWPLYSGQETSTRYVNMSKQPIIDPIGSFESRIILDRWMKFYIESQARLKEYLMSKYPKKPDEEEKVYLKAITARAFDIMRGFLPAGITTQLSWHTNLRQAWDKLALLRHHPVTEIKNIAEQMLDRLKEKYPNSFSHEIFDEQENYRFRVMRNYNYYYAETFISPFHYRTNIYASELDNYLELTSNRPQKTGLPHFLSELGSITFDFILDFGSFRDIQRHRNGVCRMPLLTTEFGFNQWYLDQLPDDIRQEALRLIEEQKTAINNLASDAFIQQYYIALGFNITCKNTYSLPAAVYVTELRSMKSVHPTLRQVAHKMSYALRQMFPNLLLHVDLDYDDWDVRRGLQDIINKN